MKPLVDFLEKKIRNEKFSPDTTLVAARKQGRFKGMICTKTLLTYIVIELFLGIFDCIGNDFTLTKP